jgi:hypothetical protein
MQWLILRYLAKNINLPLQTCNTRTVLFGILCLNKKIGRRETNLVDNEKFIQQDNMVPAAGVFLSR